MLVAGAGGGFDIYAGLPLAFALEAEGKDVHLANLSFNSLADPSGSHWVWPASLPTASAITSTSPNAHSRDGWRLTTVHSRSTRSPLPA